MHQDLKGHRALITGASSGLGEQYAHQLAARGVDLVVAARRVDRLEKLAAELRAKYGVDVKVLPSDLQDPGAGRALFETATANGAHVTMLINNAGAGPFMPFCEVEVEKHNGIVQLNVGALTDLSHRFALHMLAHGKRSYITNVGSIASFQGVPNFAVYSATKAYVRFFSEILRSELRATNVSVTCLCPGGTVTEFSSANGQELSKSAANFMMTAEAVVQAGIKGMFAGRAFVIPGFINKLTCFLTRLFPSSWLLVIAGKAMKMNAKPAGKTQGRPRIQNQ